MAAVDLPPTVVSWGPMRPLSVGLVVSCTWAWSFEPSSGSSHLFLLFVRYLLYVCVFTHGLLGHCGAGGFLPPDL